MLAYLRQRERLLDYAASHIQHIQKALTQMNLQLLGVANIGLAAWHVLGITGVDHYDLKATL
ncbi:hypothetical protein ACCS91_39375, partial [Rhizobium ruizarguesonis]